MMTHRSNGRGTFKIDRIIRPVGRIAKASGTTDPAVFHAINRKDGMLDQLRRTNVEILRDIRDGHITAAEVYESLQAGQLETVKKGTTEGDLKQALELWFESLKSETRRGYKGVLRQAGALRAGLPAHELGPLIRRYRATCRSAGVWRSFNLARSAALAFVTDLTGGQRDPLYTEIRGLKPLKRTAPRKLPPAYSYEEFKTLCAKLPKASADAARGMAYTGMLPKEFWGLWEVQADRVHIIGTKREQRVRDVPLLAPIVRPALARVTFRRHLTKAMVGLRPLSPKHFRNFFARWCDEALIPVSRREAYLGHGTSKIEDLYPRAEVDTFLDRDGEKLRTYLGLSIRDLLRIERVS